MIETERPPRRKAKDRDLAHKIKRELEKGSGH